MDDANPRGIVRSWSARATHEGATAYERFFETRLVPQLSAIPGHRGALVLRREAADVVEITVLTFWESMDAVRRFAGATPERAVVEEEARAILLAFDEVVRHDGIALDTVKR